MAEGFLQDDAHRRVAVKPKRPGETHQGRFAQAELSGQLPRRQEGQLLLVLADVVGDPFFTLGELVVAFTDDLAEINDLVRCIVHFMAPSREHRAVLHIPGL